jgi:hypothetical protein
MRGAVSGGLALALDEIGLTLVNELISWRRLLGRRSVVARLTTRMLGRLSRRWRPRSALAS